MSHHGSTLQPGSGDSVHGAGAEPDVLALLIAWAPEEPERVGEVALFEPGAGTMVLGRGEAASGSGGERVVFYRQRPAELRPTGPLLSAGLSREQLRIQAEPGGLRIERTGKCAMVQNDERIDRCFLEPGQTLLLKRQVLLYCTRRPLMLPPLLSASVAVAPTFGGPDAHGIVGESPATWRLRDLLAWTAAADNHTLLLGESGSGKELAARALHALSSRARGPFVARNAATIPETLMDAELFGNVKGYPNPGMPERPGLIGAADGGTLFLDEIGELPRPLQANLLRVLDEGGEYHNLGGTTARQSHFRLVAATNRSEDSLKHDLGARLVLRLTVPGIQERRDDIPFLCRHLLARAATRSPTIVRRFLGPSSEASAQPRIKPSLLEHLFRHEYTTNIRELDALLWRAMAESLGDSIEGPAAPRSRVEGVVSVVPPIAAEPSKGTEPASEAPRAEPGEEEIRAALKAHQGNIRRAAQHLGMSSRYVLYRLMRKYGIRGEEEGE